MADGDVKNMQKASNKVLHENTRGRTCVKYGRQPEKKMCGLMSDKKEMIQKPLQLDYRGVKKSFFSPLNLTEEVEKC